MLLELKNAIEKVHRDGHDLNDEWVQNALSFIEAFVPEDSPHHPLLTKLRAGLHAFDYAYKYKASADFAAYTAPADALLAALEADPPDVREIKTREEWEEACASYLVGDFHEPDEQDITHTITDGSLDNSGSWLCRHIVLSKPGEPHIVVMLADVLAWARLPHNAQ